MSSFLFGFTMIWIVVLLTNEADRYASKAMPTDFFLRLCLRGWLESPLANRI